MARAGDEYMVDGNKTWITNARRSRLVALLCETDPAAESAHKGALLRRPSRPSAILDRAGEPFRPAG
ncbi:isovaleryl-CoA dehydrogenase [Amycolatopsis decaplanina DSM 44594]|uniref:Isovaleryl-CoA dehydrogenase n=1 Tax=Amycolatopsis decaplanina DSM 44594 TaxID=1284240 RepID=M2X2P8_9PSEU|nr:isovaleryl-CoA dehydrogenase [Amycolatopsis decaplanina DSM 44594]